MTSVDVQDGPDRSHTPVRTAWLLGSRLTITTYEDLAQHCFRLARQPGTCAIDFANTQVLAMRRQGGGFGKATEHIDHFIPDGMPLVWCLNLHGAGMEDRVYGPTFMRYLLQKDAPEFTHYLLGGSDECVQRLKVNFPHARFIGSQTGRFATDDQMTAEDAANETRVAEEINRLSPDFIWVGLGTPKQHEWMHRNRRRIERGVLLGVGFAFDVNAGTKRDAPMWMQRTGLTWIFRMASEPRRLIPRYMRFNTLFLWYLVCDLLRGRAFKPAETAAAEKAP